jgi:hypothetical protein
MERGLYINWPVAVEVQGDIKGTKTESELVAVKYAYEK